MVFNPGINQGSITIIQANIKTPDTEYIGTRLTENCAQKKAAKSIISETINRAQPDLKPDCTAVVWSPSIVASRTTSRTQWKKPNSIRKIALFIRTGALLKLCLTPVRPNTKKKVDKPITGGHGLHDKIWNECNIEFWTKELERIKKISYVLLYLN